MKTHTTTDSSGRLCLGKKFANKMFSLKIKSESIELVPVRIIPEQEAWLYQNPEALASVQEGLKQAKLGKGKPLHFNLEDDVLWLAETEPQTTGPIA